MKKIVTVMMFLVSQSTFAKPETLQSCAKEPKDKAGYCCYDADTGVQTEGPCQGKKITGKVGVAGKSSKTGSAKAPAHN